MQIELNALFRAILLASLASNLWATQALAQGCKPLTVAERGDAPDKASAAPLFPRITVETPGRFCLQRDVQQAALRDVLKRSAVLSRYEAMIRIRADDVEIDLGKHAVSNTMPNGMTLIWFSKFAANEPDGTRLKRTRIAGGKLSSSGAGGIGIDLTASKVYGSHSLQVAPIPKGTSVNDFFADTSHLIEDVTIQAGRRAILIDGKNNVIRNNRITLDAVTAIVAQGPGVVIEGNVIEVRNDFEGFSEIDRRMEAQTPFVIRLIQADGAIVRNNVIRLLDRANGSTLPAAIQLVESTGVTLEGNTFGGMDAPVQADAASSFRDVGNSMEACRAGGTRYLPPEEGAASGRARLPACR